MGPPMSKNEVKKSQFRVTSPLLPRLRGRGVIVLVVSEPRFRRFLKTIRLNGTYIVLCWPNVDILILYIV